MWSNPVTETPLTVTSRDGTTLHARWWTESWAPRAVVLVVHGIRTGKGKYIFEADMKARGRAGMKSRYQANLAVILKQVTPAQIQLTRYYERWRKTQRLLDLPWEERVKALPRFKPVDGYEPGAHRVPPVYADPLTVDPRSSRELREAYAHEVATHPRQPSPPAPDGPGEKPGQYGVCCSRAKGCDCDGPPSSMPPREHQEV